MQVSVHYQDLSRALARIGFAEEPAEYHGTLCGALCVLPADDIDPLQLMALAAADDRPLAADTQDRGLLRRLAAEVLGTLQDEDLGFQLLLPDDEVELEKRVLALAGWCEGFLFGLASRPGLNLDQCSEDVREVIRDFAQFTQASLGEDEDLELEEGAYVELVEYIRVGAQLVYMEFRPRPVPDPSESHHLH